MSAKPLLYLFCAILVPPVIADVPTIPKGVANGAAYREYLNYQKQKQHKAFATSEQGGSSWVAGRDSEQQAIEAALKSCNKMPQGKCSIIDVNDKVKTGVYQPSGFLAKTNKPSGGFAYFPVEIRNVPLAKKYKQYLHKPGNKAFAASTSGAGAWVVERTDLEAAKSLALEGCDKQNRDKDKPCKLVDTNGEILTDKLKFSQMSVEKNAVYPELPARLSVNFDANTYNKYQSLSGHKAVAVNKNGDVYYTYYHTTAEYAQEETLNHCKKVARQECKLIMVDNRLIAKDSRKLTNTVKKPWHGRYEVDLSDEPELAAKPGVKSMMPVFVLDGDDVQIEIGGKVSAVTDYEVKGKNLSFKIQGKPVNGKFGDKYDYFILDSSSNPKYVKVN